MVSRRRPTSPDPAPDFTMEPPPDYELDPPPPDDELDPPPPPDFAADTPAHSQGSERSNRRRSGRGAQQSPAQQSASGGKDGGEQQPTVRLRFASLPLFVESYVLPNWRHPLNEVSWCARWWEHAEALSRLMACWEAFEVMRLEPAPALSVWWRDHLDVHMAALTRVNGPFKQCDARKGTHRQQPIWDTEQPPAGLFPVDDNAEIGGRPATATKEAG